MSASTANQFGNKPGKQNGKQRETITGENSSRTGQIEIGKRIGRFFKTYRIEADLTLGEVASYLGIASLETIEKYETGEIQIPLFLVFALSNLYNVPPDQVTELYYEIATGAAKKREATGFISESDSAK